MTGPACPRFLHDKLIQVVGPASVRPKKVRTYSHYGPICLLSGGQFEQLPDNVERTAESVIQAGEQEKLIRRGLLEREKTST